MKNIQRQLLIDAKEKKNRIFIATKSNLKEKKNNAQNWISDLKRYIWTAFKTFQESIKTRAAHNAKYYMNFSVLGMFLKSFNMYICRFSVIYFIKIKFKKLFETIY